MNGYELKKEKKDEGKIIKERREREGIGVHLSILNVTN
jgi:hypothetical protein